jgi:hypothetical protein
MAQEMAASYALQPYRYNSAKHSWEKLDLVVCCCHHIASAPCVVADEGECRLGRATR